MTPSSFHKFRRNRYLRGLILVLAGLICPLPQAAARPASDSDIAEAAEKAFKKSVHNIGGAAEAGVVVGDLETGTVIYQENGSRTFSPASVLKLVTTYAALKILGSDYSFNTEVFLPRSKEDLGSLRHPRNLFIRGGGDPSFRDEEAQLLSEQVAARGIEKIGDLIIDPTLFIEPPAAAGSNPYQAALSAVSIDHNSYQVTIAPGAEAGRSPGRREALVGLTPGAPYSVLNKTLTVPAGTDVSAEPLQVIQTPSSDSVQPQMPVGAAAAPFITPQVALLVKGSIEAGSHAHEIYQTVPDPPAFFGGILRRRLTLAGVSVSGRVLGGRVPDDATLLLTFKSPPFAAILSDLNHYSSNFIAGQILYALGRGEDGVFRRDRGLVQLRAVLSALGIPDEQYNIVDASGLDPSNRISPQALHRVLHAAYSDMSISSDFFSSLGRFGHTGTVKKRRVGGDYPATGKELASFLPEDSVWAKTGTLDKVSSLAGILQNSSGRRLTFVIITNGQIDPVQVKKFEDEVVAELIKG